MGVPNKLEQGVTHTWMERPVHRPGSERRASERRSVALPARLTWKDHRGATRFASVVARNVSEFGVFVECQSLISIPLYRLVQVQLERDVRDCEPVPSVLRSGRVLSAVYRVGSGASGAQRGLALRLMVDPKRRPAISDVEAATA